MGSTEQERQKKLAKQRTRAIKNRRDAARKRNELQSLVGRMRAVSQCPVAVSQFGDGAYQPAGISTVLFGRQRSDGQIVLAIYLIDLGCLGVKESYVRVVSKSELAQVQAKVSKNQSIVTVQPSTAYSLIEQAVEYARGLGFEPRGDYAKMLPIFGDVDANACTEKFPFGGEDGKPIYVRGPNETLKQADQIRNTLASRLGEGNFDYCVVMDPGGVDGQESNVFGPAEIIDRHADRDDNLLEDAG